MSEIPPSVPEAPKSISDWLASQDERYIESLNTVEHEETEAEELS